MKSNYTHITTILDRSGSMSSIKDEVLNSINHYLSEQKNHPGECTLNLVQFDDGDPYEVLINNLPIKLVEPLKEFIPRGFTPLFDAVGRGIVNTGNFLSNLPESDRPEKVLFVIVTDGFENASREYTQSKVKEMVEHQTNVYNWTFVYLGANQNAIIEGGKIGISQANSATYSTKNTIPTWGKLSDKTKQYRSAQVGTASMGFSAQERTELEDENS